MTNIFMRQLIVLHFFSLFYFMSAAFAEEPLGDNTKPGIKELMVLSPLVGHWVAETIGKPFELNPKGFKLQDQWVADWVLDRNFLRVEGQSQSEHRIVKYTWMYTYDQRKKKYHAWYFDSLGTVGENEGNWNTESKTMTWVGLGAPKNYTLSITEQFVDDDHLKFTMVGKFDDGRVVVDLSGIAVKEQTK